MKEIHDENRGLSKLLAEGNEALRKERESFIEEQKSFQHVHQSMIDAIKVKDTFAEENTLKNAIDKASIAATAGLNKDFRGLSNIGKLNGVNNLVGEAMFRNSESAKKRLADFGAAGALDSISKAARSLASFDNNIAVAHLPAISAGIVKAMGLGIDSKNQLRGVLDYLPKIGIGYIGALGHRNDSLSKVLDSLVSMKGPLTAIAGSMDAVSKIAAMDFAKIGRGLSPVMPAMATIDALSRSSEMISSFRAIDRTINVPSFYRGEEMLKKFADSYHRTLTEQPSSIFFEEMPREIEFATAALTTLRTRQIPKIPEFHGRERVRGALKDFDPDLVVLFDGARRALNDKKPDYARHAASSFRALLTTLLHRLAPNDETKKWVHGRSEFLHNGNPTRRARLEYICREQTASSQFADFFKKDVDSVLSLYDILNSEDHVTLSNLSDAEIMVVETRVACFVETVLVLNRGN
ncbi:MAG: hypothetical protein ACHQNE_02850 [Candidatus Kapaibacterium sp.]